MLLAIDANKMTVVILCIAALVFVFLDIYLVYSLHKHNKKLAKKRKITENSASPAHVSEENESPDTPLSEENVLSDNATDNTDNT